MPLKCFTSALKGISLKKKINKLCAKLKDRRDETGGGGGRWSMGQCLLLLPLVERWGQETTAGGR